MRRVLFLLVIALGCQASGLMAQTAPAVAAQGSVLAEFEQEYKTIAVIPDPLPHVERVLKAPAFHRVWNTGKLLNFIRKSDPRTVIPSPQVMWFMILQNQRWVPNEIAIGMHDLAMADVDHLFRTILLSRLADAAATIKDEKALATLRQQITAELKVLRIPPMRIWVRFRDEQDAAALFGLVSGQVQGLAAAQVLPFPLNVKADEKSLCISLSVAESFPDRNVRLSMLEHLGWISGADDKNAAEMEQALAGLRVDVSLELRGEGLRLTLGQSPPGAAMAVADLGPLYKAGVPNTIMFASWDISKLITGGEGWVKILDQWQKTPVGKAMAERDEEDFAGDLRMMARQLKSLGAAGSMRAWAGEAAVDFEMQELGVPAASPLKQSPIMKLIPADASSFMADTVTTLAERISSSISEGEGRLAMRSLPADFGARTPQAVEASKVSAVYYESFAALRQFIHQDALNWFAPGTAFVFGGEGKIRRVDFTQPDDTTPLLTMRDLPVPEVAILGIVTDKQPQGEYVRRIYDAIEQGARAAAGDGKVQSLPNVVEADLGLGVKTYVLTAPWLADIKAVRINIESDVRPHYFVHEGVLVFSTSPRLSKRMLDASRGNQSVAIPAAPLTPMQQGQLVELGRFNGQLFVSLFDQLAVWIEQSQGGVPPARPQRDAEISDILHGMGEFVALIDRFQWQAWQQDRTRTTRGDVTFAK